jgi:4-hydroxy-tetrahydrodipicolinate reductase
MKTRIAITGVTGRMGAALVRTVRDEPKLALIGGTERKGHAAVGLDVGLAAHLGTLEAPVVDDLGKLLPSCDVVIDFTTADASVEHAKACAAANVALVVGSTGFSPEAKREIGRQALSIPVVMSPNFSVGVNLMVEIAAELARRLGDGFEIDVLEAHHRMKKDSPSGTALRLAEEIARATGRSSEDFTQSRVGQVGERPRREIGLQALRGGDVIGEHTVYFFGEGERLELTHRASSRDQFARGAVRAAQWAVGKPPGLYGMSDVLKR